MPDNSWTPAAIATIALAAATIMLAVATGLNPLFQFISSRKSQPVSTPKQKTAAQKIGAFLRSPLLALLGMLINMYFLFREFQATTPVSRASVLTTAFVAAGFLSCLASVSIALINQSISMISQSIESLLSIDSSVIETLKKLNTMIELLSDRIGKLEASGTAHSVQHSAPDRATQGLLEQLSAAVNKLLRDV